MAKVIFSTILSAILGIGLNGCANNQQTTTGNQSGSNSAAINQTSRATTKIVGTPLTENARFAAELETAPDEIKAGEQATLILTVRDKQGAVVKNLQVMNEKLLHLLIVSDDLAQFEHIHGEQPEADGSFRLNYTFPNGGKYKLYADYQPPDSEPVVDVFDVNASGTPREKTPIVADRELTKTVDGLTVTLKPASPLKAGHSATLDFFVTDAGGKPVTDLQPYLGAMAHFVIISADANRFLHVHASGSDASMPEMGNMNMRVEPNQKSSIRGVTEFPAGGIYKLWAQMRRGGKVITVPFVFNVTEGDKNTAQNEDATKITVSKNGFEPASINVKKGQPIKLAFTRIDGQNCASEVVFPKLNITRNLPVGETVTVEINPQEAGEIAFACGMGMFQGKVLAQ